MERLGIILGIVALGVGLYHVMEIRRALANLAVVQSSVSTQYLGKFPRFVADIVNLVNSARDSLVVVCDYPGYGEFSVPAQALEYQQALQRKKQAGVNIDFTCLDADFRKKNIADQFSSGEWSNWQNDASKKEEALRFLRSTSDHSKIDDPSTLELVEALHEVDERLLREPYLKSVRQIALHMPIYFWIVDGQKAIFSIPTLAPGAYEHGFITSDHALVQALLDMRDRYEKASAQA
jgi:hypothetical protein